MKTVINYNYVIPAIILGIIGLCIHIYVFYIIVAIFCIVNMCTCVETGHSMFTEKYKAPLIKMPNKYGGYSD